MRDIRIRRSIAAAVAAGALAACTLAGCAGGPQDQAGSAVVPCSRIAGQVEALLPYYRFPGKDETGGLWGLESGLAAEFGNVSNADAPLGLSRAEVDWEVAVQDDRPHDRNHPWIANGYDILAAMASACGITP